MAVATADMKGAAPTDGPLAMPRPTKNKDLSPLLGESKESPTPSPLEETNSPHRQRHPRRLGQAMLHKSAAFSASQPNLAEDSHAAAGAAVPPSLYR